MPILFGTIASSNQQARADTGVMFPIFATTVGSAGASSVTFSNIPSTYTHLELRISAKNTATNSVPYQANIVMQFNGISTGTPYDSHYLGGNGSTAFDDPIINQNEIYCGKLSNNNYPNIRGAAIISILDYTNTTKNKVVRTLTGLDVDGAGEVALFTGQWRSTSAITSITLSSGNNFESSTFALYGIKGA
jgi:hypothetical protein